MTNETKPHGAFDLEFWSEENDHTCDPRSGGIANVSSMAALGGVSRRTLVNNVFPRIDHILHREGPVVITHVNSVITACHSYQAEMRARQSAAGRRNAHNLIQWVKSDPSSGAEL